MIKNHFTYPCNSCLKSLSVVTFLEPLSAPKSGVLALMRYVQIPSKSKTYKKATKLNVGNNQFLKPIPIILLQPNTSLAKILENNQQKECQSAGLILT